MKWQKYFEDNFPESAQIFKLSFILGYLFFCDNICTIRSAQLTTNLYAMFCEFKLEIFGHNEIVSVLV